MKKKKTKIGFSKKWAGITLLLFVVGLISVIYEIPVINQVIHTLIDRPSPNQENPIWAFLTAPVSILSSILGNFISGIVSEVLWLVGSVFSTSLGLSLSELTPVVMVVLGIIFQVAFWVVVVGLLFGL